MQIYHPCHVRVLFSLPKYRRIWDTLAGPSKIGILSNLHCLTLRETMKYSVSSKAQERKYKIPIAQLFEKLKLSARYMGKRS